MGLNVKLASLICLMFIGGICWLVNQVSRPVVEVPGALLAQSSPLGGSPRGVGLGDAALRRFARPSAGVMSAPHVDAPRPTMAASDAGPAQPETVREELPPLHVAPRAPALTVSETPIGAAASEPHAEPLEIRGDGHSATLASAPGDGSPASVTPAGGAAISPLGSGAREKAGSNASPAMSAGSTPPVAPPESNGAPAERRDTTYVVKAGDNLTRIARSAYSSNDPKWIRALIEANPAVKKRKGHVLAGESLRVPSAPTLAIATARNEPKSSVGAKTGSGGAALSSKTEPPKPTPLARDRQAATKKEAAAKSSKPTAPTAKRAATDTARATTAKASEKSAVPAKKTREDAKKRS